MPTRDTWVLLVGASGVIGRQTAARLRRRWPNLPILAGGRDLQRAEAVAVELDNARGVAIDLSRRDLGLPMTSPLAPLRCANHPATLAVMAFLVDSTTFIA